MKVEIGKMDGKMAEWKDACLNGGECYKIRHERRRAGRTAEEGKEKRRKRAGTVRQRVKRKETEGQGEGV